VIVEIAVLAVDVDHIGMPHPSVRISPWETETFDGLEFRGANGASEAVNCVLPVTMFVGVVWGHLRHEHGAGIIAKQENYTRKYLMGGG
jgi:hypothetical protein